MRSWVLTILLGLAACRAGGAAGVAAAPSSRCLQVADKFVQYFPSRDAPPPELARLFREIVVTRCERDGWSRAVQDCYLASEANVDACAKGMTDQQRTTFQEEAETKLVKAAQELGARRQQGDP